jgi:hypothetical protein
MADDVNNLSIDESQNENTDEEQINELRDLINDFDSLNDLVKVIEKYSK